MADKKIDENMSEAQRYILADRYGLTPEFMKENEQVIKKVNSIIKQHTGNMSDNDPEKIVNSMRQFQILNKATYIKSNYESPLGVSDSDDAITSNGYKQIVAEQFGNREDTELFNFNYHLFSNYRNLVSEYRNISRLITEVGRCANMKARDIMSINEITKKSISNVYVEPTDSVLTEEKLEEIVNPINERINTEILEKYDVENDVLRYMTTSFIEGCKPVAVYPYKDIIEMANFNARKNGKEFKDFDLKLKSIKERGSENYFKEMPSMLLDYQVKSQRLLNDNEPSLENFKIRGTENFDQEKYTESRENYIRKCIDKFVSKEDFDEYCRCGLEDIRQTIGNLEKRHMMELETSSKLLTSLELDDEKGKFRELSASINLNGKLPDHFREQIYNAIKTIDINLEFYDQNTAPIASAINNFRKIMEFRAYRENPNAGVIAYGAKERTDIRDRFTETGSLKNIASEPLNIEADRPSSVLDGLNEHFESDFEDLSKGCLIKRYDAEDVIPICVSGKHIGYYALEVASYTGNLDSINKRNNSFTDLFINLGFANDNALLTRAMSMPDGSLSSPGVTGAAPFTSDISALSMGSVPGSILSASGVDIMNVAEVTSDNALNRINIMKKIVYNVVKRKLKMKDLDDNEQFKDVIMGLIRDGAIVKNKTKFMYIPEKYMCYFSPGLDDNGIPQSFLKDCLFTCYHYLLITLNNTTTRLVRTGVRDKIELNIGGMKKIGASIRSIENSLSTRRLNVESPFTSLSRVLKASSLTELIIEPVINGEKVFQYSDISKSNDVPYDDDLASKLMNTIITSLNCPITIMNPYNEEDFASISASRNGEYRFDIIKLQPIFGKVVNKYIKLLFVGSGLYEELANINKNDDKNSRKISLNNINMKFSPPNHLNMKNANDMFGTVQTYVDNIISILFDSDDDNYFNKIAKNKVKQDLYRELFPGLEIDKFAQLADSIEKTYVRAEGLKRAKKKALSEYYENYKIEPRDIEKETGDEF